MAIETTITKALRELKEKLDKENQSSADFYRSRSGSAPSNSSSKVNFKTLKRDILKMMGKDYLLDEIWNQDIPEKKINVYLTENPLLGFREHEGFTRDFQTVYNVTQIWQNRPDFLENLDMDEIKRENDSYLQSLHDRVLDAKKKLHRAFPVVQTVYEHMLESITHETKEFAKMNKELTYKRDKDNAVTNFLNASTFVSSALDTLNDLDTIVHLLGSDGKLRDENLAHKLLRLPNKDDLMTEGQLDPAKVRECLKLDYLTEDHQNPFYQVQVSKDLKHQYKVSILKKVFGKKKLFSRRSHLHAVEEGFKKAIQGIHDDLQYVFSEPIEQKYAEIIWKIVSDEKMERQEKKELLRQLNEAKDGKLEPYMSDKFMYRLKGLDHIVDQYSDRQQQLKDFQRVYLGKGRPKTVGERFDERLETALYSGDSDRSPKKLYEAAQRYMTIEDKEFLKTTMQNIKPGKALNDIVDRLKDLYIKTEREYLDGLEDPYFTQSTKDSDLVSKKHVTMDDIERYKDRLVIGRYRPGKPICASIDRFMAMYAVAKEVQKL